MKKTDGMKEEVQTLVIHTEDGLFDAVRRLIKAGHITEDRGVDMVESSLPLIIKGQYVTLKYRILTLPENLS